jgi:hypothetical protein
LNFCVNVKQKVRKKAGRDEKRKGRKTENCRKKEKERISNERKLNMCTAQ